MSSQIAGSERLGGIARLGRALVRAWFRASGALDYPQLSVCRDWSCHFGQRLQVRRAG